MSSEKLINTRQTPKINPYLTPRREPPLLLPSTRSEPSEPLRARNRAAVRSRDLEQCLDWSNDLSKDIKSLQFFKTFWDSKKTVTFKFQLLFAVSLLFWKKKKNNFHALMKLINHISFVCDVSLWKHVPVIWLTIHITFFNVMDENNFLWFNKFAIERNKQSCESQKMLMQWSLNIYYVTIASGDLGAESIGFAKWVFLFIHTILPTFWWRYLIPFYIFAGKIKKIPYIFTTFKKLANFVHYLIIVIYKNLSKTLLYYKLYH